MQKCFIVLSILILICFTSCVDIALDDNNLCVDSEEIQWIALSYSGHEIIREEIRAYLENMFSWYVQLPDDKPIHDYDVPTAIALYDLNNDEVSEIIAFISHVELGGAKDSGGLFIFITDGREITDDIWISGFPLITHTLDDPNSKQIGIIRTEKTWCELFVRGDNAYDNGQRINLESIINTSPNE